MVTERATLTAGGRMGGPVSAPAAAETKGYQPAEPRLESTPGQEPQTCLTVEFGGRLAGNRTRQVTDTVPVDLSDGEYEAALTSEDKNHKPGFQSEQTKEQWFLEFLDGAGTVLLATNPISDLPEDVTTLTESLGRYEIANVNAVRGRHLGQGESPNSVVAVRVDFLNPNCPETPVVCPVVAFPEVRLFGRAGVEPNVSPLVPVKLDDGIYEVVLESTDRAHGPGQENQPEERWFLEGVDDRGKVVFATAPTDDIPDDQRSVVTTVGTVQASNVVAVRAVHAATGPRFNSVEPVTATFRNAGCSPDSGFELFDPSRLAATEVTEDAVTLLWFPGGGGTGHLTYTVLIDGTVVASGLTDLTYNATGLQVNTRYTIAVRAVDSAGEVTEAETLDVETQSAFRCTVDVVTVEIASGETPTDGDDVILGTEGDDQIDGLGGDDVICGLGGNDVLIGGPGDDVIEGGSGDDRIDGGDGDDLALGQDGDDTMNGDAGNDVLFGGADSDSLAGGAGDDQLYGEEGDDRAEGGAGADSLSGGAGNDTLIGSEGDDNIAGGSGNDVAYGAEKMGLRRRETMPSTAVKATMTSPEARGPTCS